MRITDKIILTFSLIVFSVTTVTGGPEEATDIRQLWTDCSLTGVVSFAVFNTAMLGYLRIGNIKKKNLLTVIDYSKPSTEKRFFVIDLKNKKLLYDCYVAHGKNSGENYPKDFSNQKQSLKSCLGFFLTAGTYSGKNGYSLQLDGLEKNINDNTREREIVIHAAEYVSTSYIKNYGRLGRSWGCPALPPEISKEVIDIISGGSCLFIYADDAYYKENSVFKIRKT